MSMVCDEGAEENFKTALILIANCLQVLIRKKSQLTRSAHK